jgi:uncharacterized membrane protein YbjE (DUF340 family)
MTKKIFAAVILGMLAGRFIIPESVLQYSDTLITIALNILLFLIGIDLGRNRGVLRDIRSHGRVLLLVPLGIVLGSMVGGFLAGLITGMPANLSLPIASGFGWYSLSGILLSNLHSPEIGAIAFLTNIFRELLAILLIPILALKLSHWSAIAPAGATSMDTTLPIIARSTSPEIVVVAFVNGALLTGLVPVLVPFLYNLLK